MAVFHVFYPQLIENLSPKFIDEFKLHFTDRGVLSVVFISLGVEIVTYIFLSYIMSCVVIRITESERSG